VCLEISRYVLTFQGAAIKDAAFNGNACVVSGSTGIKFHVGEFYGVPYLIQEKRTNNKNRQSSEHALVMDICKQKIQRIDNRKVH